MHSESIKRHKKNGLEGFKAFVIKLETMAPSKRKDIVQLGLLDGAIVGLISQSPQSTHELAMHFGSEVDFHDLQAALSILEVRKVITLSNQGWKLI